jgi:pimeloyl-ACP methyl ester carboxylesterase
MAIYVLVHGGGHGGWCYQRVARILRASGHEVYTPTLTGLGERSHLLSPKVDLNLHITDVVNALHYEDLTDVVLAGHSYGGMVITGVADCAASRIGRLVYLAATPRQNGQCVYDKDINAPMLDEARHASRVVEGVELFLFPGTDPLGYFGVTDPDDIKWMSERLTPHPWKCFEDKLELHNENALWAIPQYHIVCTPTLARRDPQWVESARAAGRLWEIDTGHDLMISEPDAVANALIEIARF